MPEIGIKSSLGKKLEVFDDETGAWVPWIVRKLVLDGRVQLQSVRDESVVRWVELEKYRYRWISEHVRA